MKPCETQTMAHRPAPTYEASGSAKIPQTGETRRYEDELYIESITCYTLCELFKALLIRLWMKAQTTAIVARTALSIQLANQNALRRMIEKSSHGATSLSIRRPIFHI